MFSLHLKTDIYICQLSICGHTFALVSGVKALLCPSCCKGGVVLYGQGELHFEQKGSTDTNKLDKETVVYEEIKEQLISPTSNGNYGVKLIDTEVLNSFNGSLIK